MPAISTETPRAKTGKLPLPDELVVCPWGERVDLAGKAVICNETTARELPANQARYGFDEVALDFDHNTAPREDEEGNPIPPIEPQPIAAMGRLSVEPGRGVIFTPTSWTPEGERYFRGRHYRDLSPTISRNESGEVTFIHSIALTRKGQISDLHAFAAPAEGLPPLTAMSVPIPSSDPTTTTMEKTTLDWRAAIAKSLKLDPATATDEEILARIDALEDSAERLADEAKKKTEGNDPALATLSAGAPTVESLSADFDKFRREQIVADATRQGKVIPLPDEEIAKLPVATLSALVANLPATVPLSGATTPAATTEPAAKLIPLSAEEKTVAARLGYTDEQWRAANPQPLA